MEKECSVIHLPTNKPDVWWNHLYILSNDEIQEGDIGQFYDFNYNKISTIARDINGNKYFKNRNIKKIIATTDSNLTGKASNGIQYCKHENWCLNDKGLPQCDGTCVIPSIPQLFIESYCKKPVDTVMVEYENKLISQHGCDYDHTHGICSNCNNVTKCPFEIRSLVPKLINNEIIIHSVEKNFISWMKDNYPMMKNHGSTMNIHQLESAYKEWIEKT